MKITVTKCSECPMYSPVSDDPDTPLAMCLHDDGGWFDIQDDISIVDKVTYPLANGLPDNCPLKKSPVTYGVGAKS